MFRPPCLRPPVPPPPSSSGSSSVPPVTVKPEPFSSASPVVHRREIGRGEIRILCGDPPQTHRSSNSPSPALWNRNILPSLLSSLKVRETTFRRETVLCSLAGTPPYTHFWHHYLPTPIPSTNTALRTANTAPSTMRFWEAASRWRSQEERIPTVGLSGEGAEVRVSKSRNCGGGVTTLSTTGWFRSGPLTSI